MFRSRRERLRDPICFRRGLTVSTQVLTAEDIPLTWRSDYIVLDNRTISTLQLTAVAFLAKNAEHRALAQQEWTARWNKWNAPPPAARAESDASRRRAALDPSPPRPHREHPVVALSPARTARRTSDTSPTGIIGQRPKALDPTAIFGCPVASTKAFTAATPSPPTRTAAVPIFGAPTLWSPLNNVSRPRHPQIVPDQCEHAATVAVAKVVGSSLPVKPSTPTFSCPAPSLLLQISSPTSTADKNIGASAGIPSALQAVTKRPTAESSFPLTPTPTLLSTVSSIPVSPQILEPTATTSTNSPTSVPDLAPAPALESKRLTADPSPLPPSLLRRLRIISLHLPLSTFNHFTLLSTLLLPEGMPDAVKLPCILSASETGEAWEGGRETLLTYATLDSAVRAFGVLSASVVGEGEETMKPTFVHAEEGDAEGTWRWSDVLEKSDWGQVAWGVERERRRGEGIKQGREREEEVERRAFKRPRRASL